MKMSTISKIADIRNTYGFYSPEMADYIIKLNKELDNREFFNFCTDFMSQAVNLTGTEQHIFANCFFVICFIQLCD